MSSDTVDTITLCVFLLPVLWIPWELILLVLRAKAAREGTQRPKLISMVARALGYKLTSIPYFWGGLGAHYWLNRATWASWYTGLIFWLFGVALLAIDIGLWSEDPAAWPRWKRVVRWPGWWFIIGAGCGWALFPQSMQVPW